MKEKDMDRHDVAGVLAKPISQELLDFETTLPQSVEDLVRAHQDR